MRGQRHALAAFYPWERPATLCTRGWVDSRAGLDRCGKISPPPGFDLRTVQPVASRYTDWATRPTHLLVIVQSNTWCMHGTCIKISLCLVFCWWGSMARPWNNLQPCFYPNQSSERVCILNSWTSLKFTASKYCTILLAFSTALFQEILFQSVPSTLCNFLRPTFCAQSQVSADERMIILLCFVFRVKKTGPSP
jgi:hypothetical protein